ncbi:MAG TPA: YceI family protein [Candidatus Angelobacter sp.]|nr:YceI family protein [Candidatus Angelobacter sp.]
MHKFTFCWILLLVSLCAAQSSNLGAAKPQQSAITIKVSKSGLFSGFAHDHVVVAPVARADVDPQRLTAEITVITKEMKVTDPEVADKDRAEIQSTMLGPKVLDQEKYPEIHFNSIRIEQTSPQHYRVIGILDLHGTKQEMAFDVTGAGDHYHGATKLKQSDFGIKPISLFGGSVKVKDQLELEFDIYAPPKASS